MQFCMQVSALRPRYAEDIMAMAAETQQVIRVGLWNEKARRRAYSAHPTDTPHDESFTTRVRARDMQCCITGAPVPAFPRAGGRNFIAFEAAHIFPLSATDEVSVARGNYAHKALRLIYVPISPTDELL